MATSLSFQYTPFAPLRPILAYVDYSCASGSTNGATGEPTRFRAVPC